MQTDKQYIIFAGINGVGKTALHNVLAEGIDLGLRISIDDIAKELGDWRDTVVQIKAARRAMSDLRETIDKGLSFHQESTLPGEAVLRYADLAKEKGYRIILYYIGVSSLDIAKERVRRRVEEGGHGIDEKVMEKRFIDMKNCLVPLMDRCDEIYFYDNTLRFRQIAVVREGKLLDLDPDLPDWFVDLLNEKQSSASI